MDKSIESCRCFLEKALSSQLPLANSAFKEICTSIATLISSSTDFTFISEYENTSDCFSYRYLLLFQFTQLISTLQLLADIIINEQKINSILKECRKSVYKRISFCLDTISQTFNSKIYPTNQSGCFLKWMDNALQKIKEVDIDIGKKNGHKEFQDATILFEDILSHAMSIAQICLNEDSKAIKGSSHSVLEALKDLKVEINKNVPNKSMVTLFVDSCGDKLCALERRVDIAVLKLSLKTFSQYLLPVERIFKFCEENSGNVFDQQEFDNIVADFDLHVDRIMQIGLFSVFCSSNIKNGCIIRSCMASLEYLELELIPIARMLLSESSEINRTSTLIFKSYWMNQANKLKTLIFQIIDPSAFCQVIHDAVNVELDVLLEKYKNEKDFSKSFFENIVQHGTVLTDFLLTVIRCEDIITGPYIKENIKNCCVVMREIQKAVEVLHNNSRETNERILKRCRVFQTQLKKLLLIFMKENKMESEALSISKEDDNQNFVSHEEKCIFENKFLDHFMKRGKNILDNRSILYRTPNNLQYNTYNNGTLGDRKTLNNMTKLNKLKLSFDSSQENESFEVHITKILDNLSSLSTRPPFI